MDLSFYMVVYSWIIRTAEAQKSVLVLSVAHAIAWLCQLIISKASSWIGRGITFTFYMSAPPPLKIHQDPQVLPLTCSQLALRCLVYYLPWHRTALGTHSHSIKPLTIQICRQPSAAWSRSQAPNLNWLLQAQTTLPEKTCMTAAQATTSGALWQAFTTPQSLHSPITRSQSLTRTIADLPQLTAKRSHSLMWSGHRIPQDRSLWLPSPTASTQMGHCPILKESAARKKSHLTPRSLSWLWHPIQATLFWITLWSTTPNQRMSLTFNYTQSAIRLAPKNTARLSLTSPGAPSPLTSSVPLPSTAQQSQPLSRALTPTK